MIREQVPLDRCSRAAKHDAGVTLLRSSIFCWVGTGTVPALGCYCPTSSGQSHAYRKLFPEPASPAFAGVLVGVGVGALQMNKAYFVSQMQSSLTPIYEPLPAPFNVRECVTVRQYLLRRFHGIQLCRTNDKKCKGMGCRLRGLSASP